jgi:hypothetical protein
VLLVRLRRGAAGPEGGDFGGLGDPADVRADGLQRGLVQLVAATRSVELVLKSGQVVFAGPELR